MHWAVLANGRPERWRQQLDSSQPSATKKWVSARENQGNFCAMASIAGE